MFHNILVTAHFIGWKVHIFAINAALKLEVRIKPAQNW